MSDGITDMMIEQYNKLPLNSIMNGYLSNDDLHKVVGYILYDLFELGLLNGKGIKLANASKKLPDEIVNEVGKSINEYIKEKLENGYVL